MPTTYAISITAVGLDSVALPVSSFNWRSSSEAFDGSFVVEGEDYAQEIADRSDGTVTLTQTVNGASTTVFIADVDRVDTFISPASRTFSISFTNGAYSQAVYASALPIDSLISYAALQQSKWSFRVVNLDPQVQHGMTVEYDGVGYYISDVSVYYSAGGSFGYTTLNEGTAP